jgi:hypothetical protein
MERTGIEPVTSDLQIPGFSVELGQVRLINAKLCWFCEAGIGYSGTRFGGSFGNSCAACCLERALSAVVDVQTEVDPKGCLCPCARLCWLS